MESFLPQTFPTVDMLRSLGYAVSTLGQIFFYTYRGDIVHRGSDSIVQSYYNSMWYQASPQIRKKIIPYMIMSQNGTRINARFLELSLYTFSRVSLRTGDLKKKLTRRSIFTLQILSSTFTMVTVLSSVFD